MECGPRFPFAAFRIAKGRLLHAERPCFAMRNTAFYKLSDYQLLIKLIGLIRLIEPNRP